MCLETKMFVDYFCKDLTWAGRTHDIPCSVFLTHHLDHINQCSGAPLPELMSRLSVISFPSVLTQSPISQHSFSDHLPLVCSVWVSEMERKAFSLKELCLSGETGLPTVGYDHSTRGKQRFPWCKGS